MKIGRLKNSVYKLVLAINKQRSPAENEKGGPVGIRKDSEADKQAAEEKKSEESVKAANELLMGY